jgi:hypothetical protein
MTKRKGKGHKALERAVKGALGTKRDKLRLVPALMGAYVNGQKTLKVAGRPDFVWVRLRGATSEVAQAFNDIVGEHWDLPILIKRDEMAHDRWRVHGRDIRAYADWGGASYLPPHAESHSFGDPDQTGGIDPVWVFKRQYMPLMPRPQVSGSMSIYLESDFYYFEGEYHWWPGSGTADMGALIPTGAFNAKFITVYIEGESGNPAFIAGDEFNFVTLEPWGGETDPASYISLPNPSEGIPIAAVRLYTGSTTIGWGDIYDLRSPQQPLGTTGSYITIFDEGVYQGAVEGISFVGDSVEAVVSGTYAYILHTGTAIDIPATGSVTVFDESVLLGQADAFNFAGDNVEAVMSGTTAHIMVTGTAGGGGGHETGTMVIYDENDWVGVFEEMRFIGAGVDAYNSGSYVAVSIPGATGGSGVGVGTGTYFRAGECVPLETITGGYWQIPEGEFATGSLCLAVNGVWQTPVDDFTEQWPTSGTFAFISAVPTGSVVSAQWGAPHALQSNGHLTGTMVVYEEGVFLGVFEEMRFIGDGVTALNSGSYVAIAITGSAVSIDIPATGSVTVFDESVLLGQADAFNFAGENVEAVMSGTTAHVMVTGTAGGGGGHETGTMVIYDEVDWLGVFEEMRFIGGGVEAYNSGSYVAVSIPGIAGGTPVSVSTGTFYIEELLYDVTLESSTGSVVFANIPQDYDHLQIRAVARSTTATTSEFILIAYNGDSTAANYRYANHHAGSAHGVSAGDDRRIGIVDGATALAGQYGLNVVEILDYTVTGTLTVSRTIAGDRSSANTIYNRDLLLAWEKYEAITRIDLEPNTNSFDVGSHFQLIGIKETVLVTSVEGGGGHLTGTVVVYEEDTFLGVFEEMRFIGDGVTALNSGSYAAVSIPSCAEGAGVYNDSVISIPNATSTAMTFNSERWDTDNIHSTVSNTGRLTCRTAGIYQIEASASMLMNTGKRFNLYIKLNDANFIAVSSDNAVISSGRTKTIHVSRTWKMEVDDYIEAYIYHDMGVATDISALSHYSPEFTMQRIG